jgi:AcrR family transcriptional regulator
MTEQRYPVTTFMTPQDLAALLHGYARPEAAISARDRKARRVLAVATRHFLRFGYRRANVEDIAREAGVAKGSIYLHFDSKRELLLHATILEKARFADRIGALNALPPRERLHRALHDAFLLVHEMPLHARLTSGDHEIDAVLDEIDPNLAPALRGFQQKTVMEFLRPFVGDDGDDALRQRAAALLTILMSAADIVAEGARRGLDPATHASLLADGLAWGFERPIPPGDTA